MITNPSIALVFLWISFSTTETFAESYYNEESFYTTIVSTSNEVFEQDRIDAKYIIEQKLSEEAFASILPYRKKIRCMAIIREIATQSGGNEYVADNYVPLQENGGSFKDLVFALTKDENIVLGGFLEHFFKQKDTYWQTLCLLLTKDMMTMISTYDRLHAPNNFKDLRKDQDGIFEHMLRVWVRGNRKPDPKTPPDSTAVSQDAEALKAERADGNWEENRDVIERILMMESIPHAQAVLEKWETDNDKLLENAVIEGMNPDKLRATGLVYMNLARYIKNKPKYITDTLHDCSGDNSVNWTLWTLFLAVNSANDWKAASQASQNDDGQTLSQFIMSKKPQDMVMAEMIAVMIDPTFKPTKFQMKPLTPGAGPNDNVTPAVAAAGKPPAAPAGTPPPVPPTNVAPPPPSG